jgi:hypothetical protein
VCNTVYTYEPNQSDSNEGKNNPPVGPNAAADGTGVLRDLRTPRYRVLLDLRALLLVTEAKLDVAAVSLSPHGPLKFYFSKNRPLTSKETDYVRSLIAIASRTSLSVLERFDALLELVIANCEKQIIARIQKVSRRLKQLQKVSRFAIRAEGRLPGDVAGSRCA